jgi:uncharacterized membrane protein
MIQVNTRAEQEEIAHQPESATRDADDNPACMAASQHRSQRAEKNVGSSERAVSVAAGSILALLGLRRASLPGLLIAAVGGAMIHRGVTGHCYAYDKLGIDTLHGEKAAPTAEEITDSGIHVEQSFLINRSPEDLYQFWRNFENLPSIMSHLNAVKVNGNRSTWTAQAPRIAGGSVEWEAEITADEPNRRIAWKSLAGSSVDTVGEITFNHAMGDRGTEVHVSLEYVPPGGIMGHWLATAFGLAPRRQIHEDLRNFKRIMEVGELPTIKGQSRGSCMK